MIDENSELKEKLEKIFNENNDNVRFTSLKNQNYEKMLTSKERDIVLNLEKTKLEKKNLLQEIEEINKENNELKNQIKKLNDLIETLNGSPLTEESISKTKY